MIAVVKNFASLIGRDLLTADDWEEVGQALCTRIVRRTREQHVDATGAAFRPYSPGYNRRKARAVGAGPVNLTLSGQMLNDLRVVAATASGCEIGFSTFGSGTRRGTLIQRSRTMGANDKAFYAVEGSHGIVRNFFDFSDADEQFVADAVERLIGERAGSEEGAA